MTRRILSRLQIHGNGVENRVDPEGRKNQASLQSLQPRL
jgi:hypothetical protein